MSIIEHNNYWGILYRGRMTGLGNHDCCTLKINSTMQSRITITALTIKKLKYGLAI